MCEITVRVEELDMSPDEARELFGAVQRTVQHFFIKRSKGGKAAVVLAADEHAVTVRLAETQSSLGEQAR
jgi:hypothetical protein